MSIASPTLAVVGSSLSSSFQKKRSIVFSHSWHRSSLSETWQQMFAHPPCPQQPTKPLSNADQAIGWAAASGLAEPLGALVGLALQMTGSLNPMVMGM